MAINSKAALNGLYNTLFNETWYVARESVIMPSLAYRFTDGGLGLADRKVADWSQISVVTVADGVDASNGQVFGKTLAATLTPSEAVGVAVLTDGMVNTDQENTVAALSYEMGQAIASKVDTDLVNLFTSFSVDKGTGAGNAATLSSVSAGIAVLMANKAPGPYNVVLHPYQWHDLYIALGLPAATYSFLGDVANEALRQYTVGQFIGARFFISSNIEVDGNGDAVGGIFSQRAIAYDPRGLPRYETERDATLRATEFVVSHTYAVGIIKNSCGVKYTSDASTPS